MTSSSRKKSLLWVVCQTFFPEVKNTVVFLNYAGKITPSAHRDRALAKIAKLAGQRAPYHLSSHWLNSGLEGRVGLRKKKIAQNVAEESHDRLSGLALVVNRLWVGWRQTQNREGEERGWTEYPGWTSGAMERQDSSLTHPLFIFFYFFLFLYKEGNLRYFPVFKAMRSIDSWYEKSSHLHHALLHLHFRLQHTPTCSIIFETQIHPLKNFLWAQGLVGHWAGTGSHSNHQNTCPGPHLSTLEWRKQRHCKAKHQSWVLVGSRAETWC